MRLEKIEERLLYGRMSYNRNMWRENSEERNAVNDDLFTSDESDNDDDYDECILA